MSPLAALAPAWVAFEILQLVVSERYLGVKQIQAGADPRRQGPSELLSFVWVVLIAAYWIWMLTMLQGRLGRTQVIALLLVSIIGFVLRRVCQLKWILVILTFEGAIRIGMLVSLTTLLWRSAFET